jgi:hypothetical protein
MNDNNGNLMSKNDKLLDSKEFSTLKRFIDEQEFNFKNNLLRIKDESEIYITQFWVNKSNTGQFLLKHKHPNSVISGVIFLDENSNWSLLQSDFTEHKRCFPWNSASTS